MNMSRNSVVQIAEQRLTAEQASLPDRGETTALYKCQLPLRLNQPLLTWAYAKERVEPYFDG